jgi:hypothetical protein
MFSLSSKHWEATAIAGTVVIGGIGCMLHLVARQSITARGKQGTPQRTNS